MQNQELLAQLTQLNKALSETLLQAEKSNNMLFFKESIKHTSMHIFENANLLDTASANTKAIPAVKIIKQQETVAVIEVAAPIISAEIKEPTKPVVAEIPIPIIVTTIEETIKTPIIEDKNTVILNQSTETKQAPVLEVKNPIITAQSELEGDDNSLNAKLAKNKIPVQNIADKLTGMPIKELAKAISISKKFELIKELFNNNTDAYKATLENIEKSANYADAFSIIENVSHKNTNWAENEDLAEEFISLVKRRFF